MMEQKNFSSFFYQNSKPKDLMVQTMEKSNSKYDLLQLISLSAIKIVIYISWFPTSVKFSHIETSVFIRFFRK
jgi:hypothetical protein